jgi:sugar phosphate isomerase/epimerase
MVSLTAAPNLSEAIVLTKTTSSPLGLDSQTLFGMPPLDHAMLAVRTGCDFISLSHGPVPWRLSRFEPWSLRDDALLRGRLKHLLREHGLGLQLAEGFVIRAGSNMADRENDLDLFADLGACKVAAVSMEPDRNRAQDELSLLCDLAGARNLQVVFEYAPPHTFNTLQTVCEAILGTGASNIGLLLDAMHFFRCGGVLADLAISRVPIGYLQLSDAPILGISKDYYKEASFRRLIPGGGELDLPGLLSAVSADVPIGLEVPMMDRVEAGENLEAIVAEIVADTRSLITANRHGN